MALEHQVATAARWSAAAQLAAQIASPVTLVVMARLLAPEDFGLVAVATLVVSFSQVFWDAGMSNALIQHAGDKRGAANVAFWTNTVLGLVLYGVLFAFAHEVARLFGDQRVTAVVQVQGMVITMNSLAAAHVALFQKNLNFQPLFLVNLLAALIPPIVGIPLALSGAGYWSLVIANLSAALVRSALCWRFSPWRPALRYDVPTAKSMFHFSLWTTIEACQGWLFAWGDTLVVAAFLGAAEVGIYRTGYMIATMVFLLLLSPIQPVLFSALSLIQADRPRVLRALQRAIKLTSMIALPVGVAMWLLSDLIVFIVLGNDWPGAEHVVGLIGLGLGIHWIFGSNASAYRAIGRPDVPVIINLAALAYTFPIYILAAPHGLDVFTFARFGILVFSVVMNAVAARAVLGLNLLEVAVSLRWIFLAACAAAFTVSCTRWTSPIETPWLLLTMLVFVGGTSYLLCLLPERAFLSALVRSSRP